MESILPSILLVTWALLWILGGWWLSRSLFSLAPNEEGMVGLVVGLTAEVGLAIWTSAGIVFAAGAFFTRGAASYRNHGPLPGVISNCRPANPNPFALL